MAYGDQLGIPSGGSNPGGIKRTLLYAEESDFSSIADYPTSPVAAGDKARILDPHVFEAGKGWKKIIATFDKRSLEMIYAEAYDVTGGKINAPFSHPGATAEVSEFASDTQTGRFIVLIEDTEGGKFIQLGRKNDAANIRPVRFSAGNTPVEYKGTDFMVEAYMPYLTFYEGNDPYTQLQSDQASS